MKQTVDRRCLVPRTRRLANRMRLLSFPCKGSGWAPGFQECGFALALQKNAERKPVREQQKRHNESWNEVGGSQLPRCKTRVSGLVESVQQIK
jgi:hypothetical protein